MTSVFKNTALAIFSVALSLSASAIWAQTHQHAHTHREAKAPTQRTVLPFDEKTWAHALQHGPRPAAYLFTTSYCSTCPAAFAVLHKAVQQRKDLVLIISEHSHIHAPGAGHATCAQHRNIGHKADFFPFTHGVSQSLMRA